MSSRFELLAPGGDLEAIHAAIAAGSDAIYLGLDRFNARNRAKNISLAELKAVCHLAHQQQCKIFVTLNVMLLESELPALLRLLNRLLKLNVDGLIAQDLGLLYLLHQHFPNVEVHASTQLNTHNEGQIDALKSLGVNRVNLARELNLEEITALTRHAATLQMKIEVFVHGSYCVGFSGLCYISSTRNGCSGNRGRCSQPCRDQYQTTEQGSAFPLNLKDNSAFAELEALAAAGVYSLKIEGRIKSSHYVFSVVSQWREQLDRYQQGQPLVKDLSNLYKVFNRDFTANYLSGEIGKAMFIDNPRNNALSHFVEQRRLTQPEQINNLKQELYQHNSELMQQMRKQIAAMQASANALPSDLQANQTKAVEVQLPQHRMEDDPNTSPNLAVLINQTHDIALSQQAKLEVFWALPNALSNKLDEQLVIFKQYPNLNPWFPAVLIDKDFAAAEQFLAQLRPKLLVTNNLGVAELAKQMGLAWVAGPQMNTANSLAIACIQQHYKGQGAFLSNELNAKQLQRLVIPKGFRSFYSIFHPNQLLSSRQCLFQQSSGCKKQRLNKSCLSRCSKSTRILNLKDAQYIIDKQAGEYNHLFSQQHVLNTQAITEMAHKFSDVLVDLRNIATDTTWSGVSNAELVTFFQDLIRQEDDAEVRLQALLTPSINQQYLKGLQPRASSFAELDRNLLAELLESGFGGLPQIHLTKESLMIIAKDDVAIFEYTVTANGEQLDTSEGKEPLTIIVGQGQLVPGLEQALIGKQVGDKFDAEIAAEEAYGERNDNLVQAVPKAMFGDVEVEVGMQFRATTDEGEQSVIIIGVEDDEVIVDGNHPLAGIDLAFSIEVTEVRKATEEELAHGHVHAPGGCGHHH